MRRNLVKTALREGKTSLGGWLTLPSPMAALWMARQGFEWLTVEMEHAPTAIQDAALMMQIVAQCGVAPLARVSLATEENTKRALDSGAWGIVFPMQNSRASVEQVLEWVLYPPEGKRGSGGSYPGLSFDADWPTYFERANDEIMVIVQIEHVKAVEAVDEILSVPGIDVALVGPQDLASSMGIVWTPGAEDPRLTETIAHIRERAESHGVAPGIPVADGELAAQRVREGFRFVSVGGDVGLMTAGARAALRRAREAL